MWLAHAFAQLLGFFLIPPFSFLFLSFFQPKYQFYHLMSNKWDNLANNILEKILKLVPKQIGDRSQFLYDCSLVNRQWFSSAQIKLYEEIQVNLLYPNKKLPDTLAHSVYRPGVWVKRINVIKVYKYEPTSSMMGKRSSKLIALFKAYNKQDPLELLMTHCPNVQKLQTNQAGAIDWQYISKVLKKKGTWKLESLPAYHDEDKKEDKKKNFWS
jgi:hypothetical protein